MEDVDLPRLHSIQLGLNTFHGDDRDKRDTIHNNPFNCKNKLIMRSGNDKHVLLADLPSLTLFKGDYCNFYNIRSVTIESIITAGG